MPAQSKKLSQTQHTTESRPRLNHTKDAAEPTNNTPLCPRAVVVRLVGITCIHNSATTTHMAANIDVATTKAKPQQLTDWNRAQTKKAAQSKAAKAKKHEAATTTTKQKTKKRQNKLKAD